MDTENLLFEMMSRGYIAYKSPNSKQLYCWTLCKIPTPKDNEKNIYGMESNTKNYNLLEELIAEIKNIIDTPLVCKFKGIVAFNHGFGIQMQELPIIEATSLEIAKSSAIQMADKILGKKNWEEIKVRPIMA